MSGIVLQVEGQGQKQLKLVGETCTNLVKVKSAITCQKPNIAGLLID